MNNLRLSGRDAAETTHYCAQPEWIEDMTDFSTIDFFRDESLAADSYPYFDFLLEGKPVWREPHHGVVIVSGWEEAFAVLRDPTTFSSCNLVAGPEPAFPVEFEGDDITEVVEQYRDQLPQSDQIVTFDPPKHTAHRALLMGLITPKRLKENEEFMWRLADRQLDEILPAGACEFIEDFAQPYTLLIIADLLGVPESDHELLLQRTGIGGMVGSVDFERSAGHHSLEPLYSYFVERIEERRREPRGDVLTGMANSTFPDGSTPDAVEVARIASNLFAAGQETTVRLLGTALQRIGDDPELQQQLRDNRDLIPRFLEETLRLEGPIKGAFRLARKSTTLGGVDIPAGTTVMLLHGATGRDPRQFECPTEFRIDRSNTRRHLAFGHGIHTCPGAPLARAEVRVCIERLFDRTANIKISEAAHGPADGRHYEYLPTYMIRGISYLKLEFTPIG
jgi:cytochrome P450 family 150 subfamily A5